MTIFHVQCCFYFSLFKILHLELQQCKIFTIYPFTYWKWWMKKSRASFSSISSQTKLGIKWRKEIENKIVGVTGYLGYPGLCLGGKEDVFSVPRIRIPADSEFYPCYTPASLRALLTDRFTSFWNVLIFRYSNLETSTYFRTLRATWTRIQGLFRIALIKFEVLRCPALFAIGFEGLEYLISRIMETAINSNGITKNRIPVHDFHERIVVIIL